MKKKLSKTAASFYKKNRGHILDIILYGSSVRGKSFPRDVDVAVIFRRFDRKEFYSIVYDLRKSLEKLGVNADVKGIELGDIFSDKMLIRPSLFIEGISLVRKRRLSDALGFLSGSIFMFSLKNMSISQKTRFQYALKGRDGGRGFLDESKGIHLGRGVVLIPIENSEKFIDFLKSWKIEYKEMRGMFIKAG